MGAGQPREGERNVCALPLDKGAGSATGADSVGAKVLWVSPTFSCGCLAPPNILSTPQSGTPPAWVLPPAWSHVNMLELHMLVLPSAWQGWEGLCGVCLFAQVSGGQPSACSAHQHSCAHTLACLQHLFVEVFMLPHLPTLLEETPVTKEHRWTRRFEGARGWTKCGLWRELGGAGLWRELGEGVIFSLCAGCFSERLGQASW